MKFFFAFLFVSVLASCGVSKRIERSAAQDVLTTDALKNAHVGISVFEPATGKYWFNYQGDKYFVPASNTKIATCYAAMKYLGDSLVGLRYAFSLGNRARDFTVIDATADPTFLHRDYIKQPAFDFLTKQALKGNKRVGLFFKKNNSIKALGSGWSWNDYNEPYMAETNNFPVFGNTIHVQLNDSSDRYVRNPKHPQLSDLRLFKTGNHYFDSIVNNAIIISGDFEKGDPLPKFSLKRDIATNSFTIELARTEFSTIEIPFVTEGDQTTREILMDSLKRDIGLVGYSNREETYVWFGDDEPIKFSIGNWHIIHSQPTDSLLRPMMHRSDNFFAEQSLLMVSNELLGYMNDEKIIDTLLKTDFKDLPQKPRWADGSGLSRYNLFTPQDFVFILNKMKNDFGMPRIKNIFATGGEGTISNYYMKEKGFIYAKTGSLSGVVALSGFLTTKKGKELIFSVQVNNHNGSATDVRRAVEKFIEGLRENF